MDKKISNYLLIVATILSISFPGSIFAAVAGDQGPSEAEIPQFEQPGNIPDEVKQYVSDKDLVSVYCAMTKWKSGQFLAAMDAVKKYVTDPIQQIKLDFNLTLDIPDTDAIKAEGQQRINAICDTSTADEAQKLSMDFQNWGSGQIQVKFESLRTDMQSQLQEKGNALRDKIKTDLRPFIDEQKGSAQKEIQDFAQQVADNKVAEIKARLAGAKSAPNMDALKEEVNQAVNVAIGPKIEQKKTAIQTEIQAKVQDLVGAEKAKFEKIGEIFQNVQQKINDYIKANISQYDQYKTQAFDLRKNLVLNILDKNIADGLAKLDAASADLTEAKKNDPTIQSVDEIKSALQQDRAILASKLDAAMEAGDENAFQQALGDFKVKWQAIQQNGEQAMQQSVSKVCAIALAQFDKANAQIDPGVKKIKDLQAKCANSVTQECVQANGFSSRFGTITSKFADLKTEMSLATSMCQDPQNANRANMIALMKKIQSDAEDVKVYGDALNAEKEKMLADTASQICSQALPQLDAAENEIKKNNLTVLENNIAKCKGKTSEECNIVNGLTGDVAKLKNQISGFSANAQKAKDSCSKSSAEENMKTLADNLNMLKSDGDALRNAAQDLQAKQSAQMNSKMLCRAVVPQLENAKQQIAIGISDVNSIDKAVVSANSGKFNDFQKQAQATLGKIANINLMCANASVTAFDQSLVDAANNIKSDKDVFDKLAADLKTLEAGKRTGVTIEAESESAINLLPRTESWHSIKGRSSESWRPPMFGTGYWYLSRGGESLSYNFTVSKDGQYNIWVRDYVDNFQPRGVRRIIMTFDGKNHGTFPETTAPVPANNKIGVFAWHKVGAGLSLKEGNHAMKIIKESTTSGAAILDSFYLTTGDEAPPEK